MASAPALTFYPTGSFQTVIADKFSYVIYSNNTPYLNWVNWALDPNNLSVTTSNQRTVDALLFSSYSMQVKCNTSTS